MRIKKIFLGLTAVFVFGCSSSKKQPETVAPPVATPPTSTAATPAQPTQPEAANDTVECKLNQATRTLKVEPSQPKGCKLFYSNFKEGQDAVAWSFKANTHCEGVRDQIRGKLEGAGYKCGTEAATQKK